MVGTDLQLAMHKAVDMTEFTDFTTLGNIHVSLVRKSDT